MLPFSVIVADIDNFKSVNDTFGHAFGDEVIKCVSTIFEKNCPADAVCARYGGEEFAMILPGNTPKTTAEHIRLEFASRLFDTPMGKKHLSSVLAQPSTTARMPAPPCF